MRSVTKSKGRTETLAALASAFSPWFILLAGVALTLDTYSWMNNGESQRMQADFLREVSSYHALAKGRLQDYVSELDAVGRFFDGSSHVERVDFEEFVSPNLKRFPEVRHLVWVPEVSHGQRVALERAGNDGGLNGRSLWARIRHGKSAPVARKNTYYPIVYQVSSSSLTDLRGLDLSTVDRLAESIAEALRDEKTKILSGVSLSNEGVTSRLLLIKPVAADHIRRTDRHQNLNGVVIEEVDLVTGLGPVLGHDQYAAFSIHVIHNNKAGQRALIHGPPSSREDGTSFAADVGGHISQTVSHETRYVQLAGENIELLFSPMNLVIDEQRRLQMLLVLFLGISLSVLVSLLIRNWRQRTRLVEAEVAQRTRELEVSEQRQKAIMDSAVDGVVTVDDKGTIISVNRATEQMFGYTSSDLIGQDVKLLMPERYAMVHDGYFQRYLEWGERKIIGLDREVVGMRKGGSEFPMNLTVSEAVVDGRRHFLAVVRDITEKKKVERIKDEFVSTVSHELRTPLTSIRGSLGLVNSGVLGEVPKQASEMLEIAGNNTDRLLLLINDLLDVQKIESDSMQFEFQPISVAEMLREAVILNREYGAQFDVRYELKELEGEVEVYADKARLIQVMNNLLSNAAKFSPPGEVVQVSACVHDSFVRISVADHGPGIPKDFQDKLFEKFTQSDASDTRKIGGTGLGLSIVRLIVEKHGGHVGFVSAEGVGATFYFDLPKVRSGGTSLYRLSPIIGSEEKILVVEDDPGISVLLCRALAAAGYTTTAAASMAQARKCLEEDDYLAMTLDLVLPDNEGVGIIKELREDPKTHHLPVVVVSASADEAQRELRGGVVGVLDWLGKPIDFTRLLQAIGKVNGRSTKNILHVEDDKDISKVLASMTSGLAITTQVSSLEVAREALLQNEYHLVILDIRLSDGNGLELLKEINALEPRPRVLVFSGSELNADLAGDVDAVLVKSKTTNEQLVEAISRLL